MILSAHRRKKSKLAEVASLLVSATLLALFGYSIVTYAAGENETPFARVSGACTSSEVWTLEAGYQKEFRQDFERFINGSVSNVQGFSDAIALRRIADSAHTKALTEYWISRALLNGKLPHIAYNGFIMVAARPPTAETLSAQLAALACLNKIHWEHPGIQIPENVLAHLGSYYDLVRVNGDRKSDKDILADTSLYKLELALSLDSVDSQQVDGILANLKGAGDYETYAKAIWAEKRGAHGVATTEFEKLFLSHESPTGSKLSKNLRRYMDSAHEMAGRSYYTLHKYDLAVAHLKKISRSSNLLAESLSELSWTFLMAQKYQDAIGTATGLQAGGMRNTFAPEAPMVMAMALNEICQYPDSVRAIATFRRIYEKPYRWIASKMQGDSVASGQFYRMAIAHLKKQGDSPVRVASEWVKSPLFISTQDEINVLFDERKDSNVLAKSGSSGQRKLGDEIGKLANDLKVEVKIARKRIPLEEPLPQRLTAKLNTLRKMIISYKRLMNAAPVWRTVLNTHDKRAGQLEKVLVARIDEDIRRKNVRMMRQVEEIGENIQLIEVEIYNGATHDIIWQNAHPDYKQLAKKIDEANRVDVSSAKVWDWGRAPANLDDENAEIWEDELGSFKADTYDNCSSRDKYLAIKMRRAAGGG